MKLTVHEFVLSDVDDPEIYAAGPLYEWEKSEVGQWVMEHSKETPVYHIGPDFSSYGYKVRITADLEGEAATWFLLKWKNTK